MVLVSGLFRSPRRRVPVVATPGYSLLFEQLVGHENVTHDAREKDDDDHLQDDADTGNIRTGLTYTTKDFFHNPVLRSQI